VGCRPHAPITLGYHVFPRSDSLRIVPDRVRGACCAKLALCSLRAVRRRRQSTLAHTGMSRRMRLLLTLCNSSLSGTAQVAAVTCAGSDRLVAVHGAPGMVVLHGAAARWLMAIWSARGGPTTMIPDHPGRGARRAGEDSALQRPRHAAGTTFRPRASASGSFRCSRGGTRAIAVPPGRPRRARRPGGCPQRAAASVVFPTDDVAFRN
jgi:hypothetical protein